MYHLAYERRWSQGAAPGYNKHSLRYWRGDRQQPVAYEYIAPARAHTEKGEMMRLLDPSREIMQRLNPEGQPNERMRREARKALAHYRINRLLELAWVALGISIVLVAAWMALAAR